MIMVNTSSMTRPDKPTAVCLGYFDGVHRGHLALLEEAKRIAARNGFTVAVHALDRSPAEVLHPQAAVRQLTDLAQKAAVFAANGCELLAVSTFDERLRMMPGKVFFREIILDRLHAGAVITGDDHRFGYRGDTGVPELRRLCGEAGISLSVVPRVTLEDGTVISSSAIRQALDRGDTALAQTMLGRPVSTLFASYERQEETR